MAGEWGGKLTWLNADHGACNMEWEGGGAIEVLGAPSLHLLTAPYLDSGL